MYNASQGGTLAFGRGLEQGDRLVETVDMIRRIRSLEHDGHVAGREVARVRYGTRVVYDLWSASALSFILHWA